MLKIHLIKSINTSTWVYTGRFIPLTKKNRVFDFCCIWIKISSYFGIKAIFLHSTWNQPLPPAEGDFPFRAHLEGWSQALPCEGSQASECAGNRPIHSLAGLLWLLSIFPSKSNWNEEVQSHIILGRKQSFGLLKMIFKWHGHVLRKHGTKQLSPIY